MKQIIYTWIDKEKEADLRTIANDPAYEWEHNPEYFEELLYFKRALVAYDEGNVVGYLLFQIIWGNTPFLSQVWIKDSYQGQGIGKEMVDQLEDRLIQEGYDSLTASNEQKNIGAIAFVGKIGFVEIGTLEMSHGPEVFSLKKLAG